MRRVVKIILAIFVVFIIGIVAFGAIIFLDLSAYVSAGSQTLSPSGTSLGNALVVYDAGLSGAAKSVADKVASELQDKGYAVTLAGVKSSNAANVAGKKILVAGGPVYAGGLTSSIKDFLNSLMPDSGAKIGVFGSGSGPQEDADIAQIKSSVTSLQTGNVLQNAVIVKIGSGEDLNSRSADFVNRLLS